MFRKYSKTYHLKSGNRKTLTKDEANLLLSGTVILEEKMDGANTGIIRHKDGFHLQKRGSLVGRSEHPQFQRFHAWARDNFEKIYKIPKGWTVYGEWLYAVHTVYYDSLPDYFLVFDIWNGERFLNLIERIEACAEFGMEFAPIRGAGSFTADEIIASVPKESQYGDWCEGLVVKRYTKDKYYRAKVVKPEFQKIMYESDHWINKAMKVNSVR